MIVIGAGQAGPSAHHLSSDLARDRSGAAIAGERMSTRALPLTERECGTLERLGRGQLLKEVAAEYGVSINTANTWAQRAYMPSWFGAGY